MRWPVVFDRCNLADEEIEAMVEQDLPFGPRTARMLMAGTHNRVLADRRHVSVLPPAWGTLYELSLARSE